MTEDKDIEQLFSTAITQFDDNGKFDAELAAKLDKIEFVKRLDAQKRKRYRVGLIAAFAAGAVFVCAFLAVMAFVPSVASLMHSSPKLTYATALAVIFGAAAICIAFNVMDFQFLVLRRDFQSPLK